MGTDAKLTKESLPMAGEQEQVTKRLGLLAERIVRVVVVDDVDRDEIVLTLRAGEKALLDLKTDLQSTERERSRLSEELATIATTLVSAGFRGDDVVKGVEWLARQPLRGRFTEAREEIARLTDVNAKLLREQADWSDRFHDKKERAEAAESELAQARAEIERLRVRAVTAEHHKALELLSKGSAVEQLEMRLREQLANAELRADAAEASLADAKKEIKRQRADIAKLSEALLASEAYRRAYQKAKYDLYAMDGEIADAAMRTLPCSEGPLESYVFWRLLLPQHGMVVDDLHATALALEAAAASLVRLRAQVGEVIARWRERAVDDPRNRVIGVGILTCADDLSALLASLSAPGQETAQDKEKDRSSRVDRE